MIESNFIKKMKMKKVSNSKYNYYALLFIPIYKNIKRYKIYARNKYFFLYKYKSINHIINNLSIYEIIKEKVK